MTNTHKKRILMILASIFFVVSLSIFLLIYHTMSKKNDQALLIKADAVNEVLDKDKARSFTGFFYDSSSQISELEKHFINHKNIVPFLSFVENLAPRVGASAKVALVETTKDGRSLFVEIKSDGSFESIYKYLKLLEQAPYKLEFLSVSFRSSSEDETGTKWLGDFRIKVISFIP